MTFWELVRSVVRYWALVIVCAVCTAAIGWAATHQDPVYSSRSELVFLAPTSARYPNALRTQSVDLILTAGAVAKRVSGPAKVTKFTSPETTLVGIGVRDGWSLRLPDTGGQWATNFTTQVLILEVVGPTEAAVRDRQSKVTADVEATLFQLQRDFGVAPINDITILASPGSAVIYRTGGSRPRVLAMTALLGAGSTLALVVVLDRRRRTLQTGS